MFVTPYSILRAVRTYIGKSPICLAAGLGMQEGLETRPTDAMVGGTGAARPAASAGSATPTTLSTHDL